MEQVQSRKCYETAVKHGKKVVVMEPVKGGTLAKLPKKAEDVLKALHPDWSAASWADPVCRKPGECDGRTERYVHTGADG